MHFLSTLLISVLAASTSVSAGRDYERKAAKNLLVGQWENEELENGWCPLPPKASGSQCLLALERVVKQPQTCPQKYMSGAARAVYLPIYNWFINENGTGNDQLGEVAVQFSRDNGVGVEIYDAFGNEIVNVGTDGVMQSLPLTTEPLSFELARTWALNYPTFLRDEPNQIASITQNVYSVEGELLTIVIYKELSLLPIVC